MEVSKGAVQHEIYICLCVIFTYMQSPQLSKLSARSPLCYLDGDKKSAPKNDVSVVNQIVPPSISGRTNFIN